MFKNACNWVAGLAMLGAAGSALAIVPVEGAPAGEARTVASEVIKKNFPSCQKVSNAARQANGTIMASCDGKRYWVFTMLLPSANEPMVVALDCDGAKGMGIECGKLKPGP